MTGLSVGACEGCGNGGGVYCGVKRGLIVRGLVWRIGIICAEDAQAHATACQKLYRWNACLRHPHHFGRHSARRTESDAETVYVITVVGRSGKYVYLISRSGVLPMALNPPAPPVMGAISHPPPHKLRALAIVVHFQRILAHN